MGHRNVRSTQTPFPSPQQLLEFYVQPMFAQGLSHNEGNVRISTSANNEPVKLNNSLDVGRARFNPVLTSYAVRTVTTVKTVR